MHPCLVIVLYLIDGVVVFFAMRFADRKMLFIDKMLKKNNKVTQDYRRSLQSNLEVLMYRCNQRSQKGSFGGEPQNLEIFAILRGDCASKTSHKRVADSGILEGGLLTMTEKEVKSIVNLHTSHQKQIFDLVQCLESYAKKNECDSHSKSVYHEAVALFLATRFDDSSYLRSKSEAVHA